MDHAAPRRLPIVLVLAAALGTVALETPSVAHAGSACGGIRLNENHTAQVVVPRGGTGCRWARRVLGADLRSRAPRTGSSCARRIGTRTWQAAPGVRFPRPVRCAGARTRIDADSPIE
jgi:hypothetical protein